MFLFISIIQFSIHRSLGLAHSPVSTHYFQPSDAVLSWHRSFRDHIVELNRWAGVSWDKSGQQVLKPFTSHSTWETARLYPMKAAAGVKLNYDFSDLKYKHGPVEPLRSLKVVWIYRGKSYTDTTALTSPHNHLIMSKFKTLHMVPWGKRTDARMQNTRKQHDDLWTRDFLWDNGALKEPLVYFPLLATKRYCSNIIHVEC